MIKFGYAITLLGVKPRDGLINSIFAYGIFTSTSSGSIPLQGAVDMTGERELYWWLDRLPVG